MRCALKIAPAVSSAGVEIRAGLHTGEIVELLADDLGRIAAHIGPRVVAMAAPAEVLSQVRERTWVAGSGLRFDNRGSQSLKGVPGQ